ncbi:hypothetical protein V493_02988 [Pseudogymnoascus sp. VKM F-4281 (FW-2241)]|nr:hypothetical protein V493_02988 [Pseudogymnoascus sp. VKM F-4281 (FW-2241)]
MPITLLTLPAEIRDQIWDYCLVSPTQRVLPVHRPTLWDSKPSSLIIYTATRATRKPKAPRRNTIFNTLHLVPCDPTTATLLSPSLLPLAHSLPLVNRQIHIETSTSLWSSNTLVLPSYAIATEVLAYLGNVSMDVQCAEMMIGNVWDLRYWQILRMMETFDELAQLVQEGSLRRLRLVYVDGGACHRAAFQMWMGVLFASERDRDWGQCVRELVWEENKMKTDKLREVLARQWGLEGGKWGWDGTIRDEDWEPAKQLVF